MQRSELIKDLKEGDFRAIARSISIVENDLAGADEILLSLQPQPTTVIGFTGPPGAGKSTLVNATVGLLLDNEKRVAVLAIDPSSPFNFGALLGDRIRMLEHFKSASLYIRSLASRGSLGGLSSKVVDIVEVLKSAGFDYIIIETVGVGQSEVDIAGVADTTVVVLVPESGDHIQGMKAGLLEIADLFVINKADREGADNIYSSLQEMMMLKKGYPQTPIIKTIATKKEGIAEFLIEIQEIQQEDLNPKRLHLLANVVYQTIQKQKMRGISIVEIMNDLKLKYTKEENIYKYINDYIASKSA